MPDDVRLIGKIANLDAMSFTSAVRYSPLAVLSTKPVWRRRHIAAVLAVASTYGLVGLSLSHSLALQAHDVEAPAVELIEVQVEPAPSVEAAPSPQPVTEEQPPPAVDFAEATPLVQPVMQEQTPPTIDLAGPAPPPDEAPASSDVDTPAAPVVTEPSPKRPVTVERVRQHPANPAPRRVAAKNAPQAGAATAPAPVAGVDDGQPSPAATEVLAARIRTAVQAAVQCPAAARMMGQSGKASIAFDYRDGVVVGGLKLVRSTGVSMLDSAALSAVRTARYPQAPSEELNQTLHFLVWVEEACSS